MDSAHYSRYSSQSCHSSHNCQQPQQLQQPVQDRHCKRIHGFCPPSNVCYAVSTHQSLLAHKLNTNTTQAEHKWHKLNTAQHCRKIAQSRLNIMFEIQLCATCLLLTVTVLQMTAAPTSLRQSFFKMGPEQPLSRTRYIGNTMSGLIWVALLGRGVIFVEQQQQQQRGRKGRFWLGSKILFAGSANMLKLSSLQMCIFGQNGNVVIR